MRPIFEEYDHLLVYPLQHEGLEISPNIIYTGATPNQQIIPAVKWSFTDLGHRVFLVGSDYVFPRTANALIRDQIAALRGEVVGEAYLPLGSTDITDIIGQIQESRPEVILNTINGDSNIAFFRALRKAGYTSESLPVVSFSIAEPEVRSIGPKLLAGHYAAWNYFQSIDSPANQAFLERFHAKYGPQRLTSDPIEAAYFGVHLWARAVESAGNTDVAAIRQALKGESFEAPEGPVKIDVENQHTWKIARIGKITDDGRFDIFWSSSQPIRPEPYPSSRTKEQWEEFLNELYQGWGGHWEGPRE